MELGSYQENITVNYWENTLRRAGVQASFLHDKIIVFLIISCSISKLLTRNTRKIHCVYYPLSHDSYSTLSSSNMQWTWQILSLSIILVEGWDIYEKSSQMVRYRPYRSLFSIFFLDLFLPNLPPANPVFWKLQQHAACAVVQRSWAKGIWFS